MTYSLQYNLLQNTAGEDNTVRFDIPSPASGVVVSFGGHAIHDPGGSISDVNTAVPPGSTGETFAFVPLIGTYLYVDSGYYVPSLIFAAPSGARVVCRTWALISS